MGVKYAKYRYNRNNIKNDSFVFVHSFFNHVTTLPTKAGSFSEHAQRSRSRFVPKAQSEPDSEY